MMRSVFLFSGRSWVKNRLGSIETRANREPEAIELCEIWGSPLHRAVAAGDESRVAQLLDAGVGYLANTFDFAGRTPLMLAVAKGRLDLAKLLLDAGAEVNACDTEHQGVPALAIAAASQGIEMIQLLLDAGANPVAPDVVERTAYYDRPVAVQAATA